MKRALLLFLIIIVLFGMDSYAFAEEYEELSSEVATRVREISDLRETNSDTYLLSDGSYESVVYADDKYYRDNTGELVEIDNSIICEEMSMEGNKYSYVNKANYNKMHFSNEKPAILIESKDNSISFEMIDSQDTLAIVGGEKTINSIPDFQLSGDNYISYPNIKPQTDLVYEIRNGVLKEYIIINGPNAPTEFSFKFDSNLYFKEEEGIISICDINEKELYRLEKLFALDSSEAYTEDLNYNIYEKRGYNIITVSISNDYISDSDRVYPIIIDPSVVISGENNTYDAYVSSSHPSTNYQLKTLLKTGWSENFNIRRSYIKFDLPSGVTSGVINSAYLRIRKTSGGIAPTGVRARRVTSSWSSSTVTWNNKPSTAATGNHFTFDSDGWYKVNVKTIVKKWAEEGVTNRGFELIDDTESGSTHWTDWYSSDAASPNKPELHINYSNTYGTRPYQYANGNVANCMGYALEYKEFLGADKLNINESALAGKTTSQMLAYIKTKSETWMDSHLGSSGYTQISAYNSNINTSSPGWFRVILRVGFKDSNSNGVYDIGEIWDYHWWYQTNENSGQWADKPGRTESRKEEGSSGVDPATLIWEINTSAGTFYYNSAGVYYQIKDARSFNW